MVVIDGNNVAYSRKLHGKPMVENIEIAIKYFEPKTVVDIFVTTYLAKFINNLSIFRNLVNQGVINEVPHTVDDDKVILKFAYDYDDYIVSNDKFRNHKEYSVEWIKNHRIGFSIRKNIFHIDRKIESYNMKRMTRMFSKKQVDSGIMEELN